MGPQEHEKEEGRIQSRIEVYTAEMFHTKDEHLEDRYEDGNGVAEIARTLEGRRMGLSC